jgi:hypothetical protein
MGPVQKNQSTSSATGSEFLGFPVPKGVPLILQLEEGGSFKRRVKAVGLASSEQYGGLKVGQQWFFSKSFDLAKARQVEQLKLLIRNNVDLVIVDSARAVARSLSVDENHADFGKLVIRKIAKLINDCGKAGVIIHHNSGSGKASGTKDIPAGVWAVFNLKQDDAAPNLRTIQTDKIREGTSILWQLSLDRTDGHDGSSDGWQWGLVADLSHMGPDLNWRKRFNNLLLHQTQPISFSDAKELMCLSDSELHSMRNSVLRDRSLMRWAVGSVRKGVITRFLIPQEFRLHTSDQNHEGAQTRETHPLYENQESMEVEKEDSQRQDSSPPYDLQSESERGSDLHTNARDLYGVSLSEAVYPPAETENSVEVPKGVPAWVDGTNGWSSPSGVLKGEYVLLVDHKGVSRRIARKRVSLTPPTPSAEPITDQEVFDF